MQQTCVLATSTSLQQEPMSTGTDVSIILPIFSPLHIQAARLFAQRYELNNPSLSVLMQESNAFGLLSHDDQSQPDLSGSAQPINFF
mmetsp:Transcript_2813/g.7061  ORF Transcript_2813/g.7061 Transcript_2813/m.7061 type:complete len:87 (+) Transcript_2813:862-1122(+)